MFKGIQFVVKTHSEEERMELRDLIFSKRLAASVTNEDVEQFIAISAGDVWFLSTISEEYAKTHGYDIFESVEEFIKFYNAGKDKRLK